MQENERLVTTEIRINREHKDRLFRLIFGKEEYKQTYNPNMPIRGFMYAARLYNKYIEENKLSIYGKTMMKLPTPQYIVFYNGDEEHEDEEILRLSDAFETTERIEGYEWTARMLNINYGRNL